MLLDAHIHLQDCDDTDLKDFLAVAQAEGISRFLCNGTKPDDWSAVDDLSQAEESIVPCYGVHPWCIEYCTDMWDVVLQEYLQKTPYALVGEIGIDAIHNKDTLEEQRAVFTRQIEIAAELNRSCVIHCVGAWGMLVEILRQQVSLPRFMVHYYSGSKEIAREIVNLGGYISFATNILDEATKNIHEVLMGIPQDRLLLETDYPYVSRGISPEVPYVQILQAVYKKAAAVRKVTEKEIEEMVYHNGTIFTN